MPKPEVLSEPSLDVDEVRNLLLEACSRLGGEAEFAKHAGVTQHWVRAVLNTRRTPRGKILDALGLQAVTVYRPKRKQ
jgi:RNase P/RNase MRP subunit POP5